MNCLRSHANYPFGVNAKILKRHWLLKSNVKFKSVWSFRRDGFKLPTFDLTKSVCGFDFITWLEHDSLLFHSEMSSKSFVRKTDTDPSEPARNAKARKVIETPVLMDNWDIKLTGFIFCTNFSSGIKKRGEPFIYGNFSTDGSERIRIQCITRCHRWNKPQQVGQMDAELRSKNLKLFV